jgi:hypothetical protein
MRRHVLSLAGTLAILALVPGSLVKLAALLVWWGATAWPIERRELVLFAIACPFFTIMDAMAVASGAFRFAQSEFLGIPVWEVPMWGFWLVNSARILGWPRHRPDGFWYALSFAFAFAAAFGSVDDQHLLLLVTGALLVATVAVFHEKEDRRYLGYFVLLGAVVEYVGVWSGNWSYPDAPPGGVAPWFVTLWGSVGLLARRLALPLLIQLTERRIAPAR